MFEIVSHRWEEGRVVISRQRPLFEKEEQAQEALKQQKKNRKLRYYIRKVDKIVY